MGTVTIVRRTGGGTIEIGEHVTADLLCACCGADDELISIAAEVAAGPRDGRRLDAAICGTCLSRAIAVRFGAAHVRAGGQLEDLDPDA